MKTKLCSLALLILLTLSALAPSALAQVPQRLAYQGLLTAPDGTPAPDGPVTVTFRLYPDAHAAEPLWTETQTLDTRDGLFAASLGAREALALPFDRPYLLTVTPDGAEESPRVPLLAAPYSLAAATAETAATVADGAAVRSINGLRDEVELVAGQGIVLEREGNRLTITGVPRRAEVGLTAAISGTAPGTAPKGPGGSNTGLDAQYDLGATITVDGPAVKVLAATTQKTLLEVDNLGNGGNPLIVRGGALKVETLDGKESKIRFRTANLAGTFDQAWLFSNGIDGTFRIRDETAGASVMQVFPGGVVNTLSLRDGKVGILNGNPSHVLDVAGTAKVTGFILPTGASAGHVLTSDASGVATWQAPTGGGGSLTLPYTGTTNSANPAFRVVNNGSGAGLSAQTSGDGVLVERAGVPTTTLVSELANGLEVQGAAGHGVYVGQSDDDGLVIERAGTPSSTGDNVDPNGVEVRGTEGNGLFVGQADENGVLIQSAGTPSQTYSAAFSHNGIEIHGAEDHGVFIGQADNDGIHVQQVGNPSFTFIDSGLNGLEVRAAQNHGVFVGQADDDGIHLRRVGSPSAYTDDDGLNGLEVRGAQDHGVFVGQADDDGFVIQSAGLPSSTSEGANVNGIEVRGAQGSGLYVGQADEDGIVIRNAGAPTATISSTVSNGLEVRGAQGNGVFVGQADADGIVLRSAGTPSAINSSAASNGVEVRGAQGHGVFVGQADDDGLVIANAGVPSATVAGMGVNGIEVRGAQDNGVFVGQADADGVVIENAGVPSQDFASALSNGLEVRGAAGHGVFIGQADADGVVVRSAGAASVTTNSTASNGVEVRGAEGHGVFIGRADMDAVHIASAPTGVYIVDVADGVHIEDAGGFGIRIEDSGFAGLAVDRAVINGVQVLDALTGVLIDGVDGDGFSVNNAGGDGIRIFDVNGYGIWTSAGDNDGDGLGAAGRFDGDVEVNGTVLGPDVQTRIDHPLDPTGQYLQHALVDAPERLSIYNGNIVTDGSGFATVTLPDWFEAVNGDFRYQLTVIGTFAQAIIAEKIRGNRFVIQTDTPDVEVSWQVTGVRRDPHAAMKPMTVEVAKHERERGTYLHPEAYGQPAERGTDAVMQAREAERTREAGQAREAVRKRERQRD